MTTTRSPSAITPTPRKTPLKPLARQLNAIPDRTHETRRYPARHLPRPEFRHRDAPAGAPDVYLEGATTRHAMLSRDAGPRAVLNALDRLADAYPGQIADRPPGPGHRRRPAPRLPGPAGQALRPRRLSQRADGLARPAQGRADRACPREGGDDAQPGAEPIPVAELADRIKSLKSAHTIDAAPERTAPRRIAAEEPVTARIRRRTVAEPAIEPEPAAAPADRRPGSPRRGTACSHPSLPGRPARLSGPCRPSPAAKRPPTLPVLKAAASSAVLACVEYACYIEI